MTCSSVDLPDPEGPTIATSSPRRDGEGHAPQGEHRGLLAVDLGDLVELQYGVAHIDGTDHEIALAQLAFDLDASAAGVEQAQLHGDQLASPTGAHDLDGEPAAGLADQRGDRDAQGVVHALGGDVHLDRGLVEPARLGRVVEADEGRDGRVGRLAALSSRGLGDSSEPRDPSRHRRVARQRDLGPVALLDLALLGRVEVHLHVQRVGRGAQHRCTRPGGSPDLAGDLGDPDRLGQEDRVTESRARRSRRRPCLRWSTLSACSVFEVKARVAGRVVAELVQVAVELTDVPARARPRAGRGRPGPCRTAAPPACRPPGRARRRSRPCPRSRAAGCTRRGPG